MSGEVVALATSEIDFAGLSAALGISLQGAKKRATKEAWPFREQPVRGGMKRLFNIATLPLVVRTAVQAHRANTILTTSAAPSLAAEGAVTNLPALSPAVATPVPAGFFIPGGLTDHQRLARDARQLIKNAIETAMRVSGCGKEAAMITLLTLAKAGGADPMAVKALRMARDGRGRKGDDSGFPSVRTLKRWLTTEDLTPRVIRPDLSIPVWAKTFLACYQQPQKPSVEEAYKMASNAWGCEPPSIHQVRRFLSKLGTVTRERGRMGDRELKTIRPYITRSFDELEPNDIWTGDGHTFDAEVQHPFHGRPFRPEITPFLDVATRRCVSWSVDLAESGMAVLDSVRAGAESSGLPAILYVDNGSGYDNALLKAEGTGLAGRMGFEVKHSIAYNSQARGVIERFHQVLVKAAKMLPSYIGAAMDREAKLEHFKVTRKALKAGGAMPLIPWEVFKQFIAERIAEYNAAAHRSLGGTSPDLRWRAFEAKGWQPHRLATADLDTLFRPRVLRTISRGRINLFTNYYSNNALEEFHGDRVMVAYDIHNPDRVWLYTPEGRFIGDAQINGNTRHYMPVAVVQQAREKRAAAREKRVKAKLVEIREEMHGPALEAPRDNEIVLAGPIVSIEHAIAAGQLLQEREPVTRTARPLSRSERPIGEIVDEWMALDARLAAGEPVGEDDAYWHQSVQRSPAWRAEMKRREADTADGRRAAG